jgi:hypothetical protein
MNPYHGVDKVSCEPPGATLAKATHAKAASPMKVATGHKAPSPIAAAAPHTAASASAVVCEAFAAFVCA